MLYLTREDSVGLLPLSVRTGNCLRRADIHTVGQMLDYPEDAWEPTLSPDAPGTEVLQTVTKRLADFTGMPQGELLRLLAPCREDAPDADAEDLLDLAFQQAPICREVRRAILRLLEQYEEEVRPVDLLERLPAGTSLSALELLLEDLLRREQIAIQNNRVRRRWPTVREFADRVSNQRQRDILLSRLRGETLDEIGQRLGLTRERVRQLTNKALDRRPRLHEDQYQDLYNRYDFSRENFLLAFGEPEETYYYLEMIRPKGERRPIQELMADESVPVPPRRRAERTVYKKHVTIDGVRVLKSRLALVHYTVRTFCRETTGIDEFLQQYQRLLESLDLERDGSLTIDSQAYAENRLQGFHYPQPIGGRLSNRPPFRLGSTF